MFTCFLLFIHQRPRCQKSRETQYIEKCTWFLSTNLVNLNNSTDVCIMTLWDQGNSKGPIQYIKTKKFKIDNINCERGFLYILGNPGPQCYDGINPGQMVKKVVIRQCESFGSTQWNFFLSRCFCYPYALLFWPKMTVSYEYLKTPVICTVKVWIL